MAKEIKIHVDTSDCEFAGLGDTITIKPVGSLEPDEQKPKNPYGISDELYAKIFSKPETIIIPHGDGTYNAIPTDL